MTVKINRDSGAAPRELVESLVEGQTYPFQATLVHHNTFPLVVPSAGITTAIAPGVETPVRIRSFDQAWGLVTDLAELATRAENTADDYAELSLPVTKTKGKRATAAAAAASEAV